MNYQDWPGKTWTIMPLAPDDSSGAATDVAEGDTLTFEIVSNSHRRLLDKIRITQFSCPHGNPVPPDMARPHDAKNWTVVCDGKEDKVVGFTPNGLQFEIVSSMSEDRNILTCTLLTTSTSTSPCWTASDGGSSEA